MTRGSTVTLDAMGCQHFIAQDTIDKGIGVLDVTRTTNNEVEYSKRYFLTIFAYNQIDTFMKGVREHWNIEIGLHWSLDVSFREDLNQVRIGYAAKNLATVRRIALNLLKQEVHDPDMGHGFIKKACTSFSTSSYPGFGAP